MTKKAESGWIPGEDIWLKITRFDTAGNITEEYGAKPYGEKYKETFKYDNFSRVIENCSYVKVFRTLLTIDSNLKDFLKQAASYFSIEIDNGIIEKIFMDAETDQVSDKNYIIFAKKVNLLKSELTIEGVVDECEPESIWIVIQNLRDKDVNHLESLISG